MSYLLFSRRLAKYISKKADLANDQETILAYIIEVIVLNALNILLAVIIGVLLGVLQYTLICILTVALLRHTAGGAHSSSPLKCSLITIFLFPSMAMTAKILSNIQWPGMEWFFFIGLVISFIIIIQNAPAETPAAPIVSFKRKQKLKFLTISIMIFIVLTILYLKYYSQLINSDEIQYCLLLSVFWSSFIISKPGYGFIRYFDSIENPCKVRR